MVRDPRAMYEQGHFRAFQGAVTLKHKNSTWGHVKFENFRAFQGAVTLKQGLPLARHGDYA